VRIIIYLLYPLYLIVSRDIEIGMTRAKILRNFKSRHWPGLHRMSFDTRIKSNAHQTFNSTAFTSNV